MGYGHRVNSLEAFLGSMGSVTSPESVRHRISALRPTDLPMGPPTCLPRVQPAPGRPTLLRPPFATRHQVGRFGRSHPLSNSNWVGREHGGTRISTCCASTTPFGLALAPDSPWADEPSPGTLGHSAEGFLPPLSLLMPAFALVTHPRLDYSAASPA